MNLKELAKEYRAIISTLASVVTIVAIILGGALWAIHSEVDAQVKPVLVENKKDIEAIEDDIKQIRQNLRDISGGIHALNAKFTNKFESLDKKIDTKTNEILTLVKENRRLIKEIRTALPASSSR